MKAKKLRKNRYIRALLVFLAICLILTGLTGCKKKEAQPAEEEQIEEQADQESQEEEQSAEPEQEPEEVQTGDEEVVTEPDQGIFEDAYYYTKDEVALYIHLYGHLPGNYMTKSEAKKLGWSGGSLEEYAEGMVIGGDRFGNYEGNLPEKNGRTYTECDIDTLGKKKRGAKRIVFSNDGLIYYTEDHYETFELLYGEENL